MTAQLSYFSAETSSRDIRSEDEGQQGMCELRRDGVAPQSERPFGLSAPCQSQDQEGRAGGHQVHRNGDGHRQGDVREEERQHPHRRRPRLHTSGQHRRPLLQDAQHQGVGGLH